MDSIEIQVKDTPGNWQAYSLTQNISALITEAMRSLKWQFPDQTVRAIDGNGRFLIALYNSFLRLCRTQKMWDLEQDFFCWRPFDMIEP